MGNVHESDDEYTHARYEAALKGNEYTRINHGGIVELAELYCSKPGNGANGRAHGDDAQTVQVRLIDMCMVGEALPT